MINTVDKSTILYETNILHAPGIANTDQAVRHYIFRENSELDYTAAIAAGGAGTYTISELPTTTLAIGCFIQVNNNNNIVGIAFQNTATSTNYFNLQINDADYLQRRVLCVMTVYTNNNKIYIVNVNSTIHKFHIKEYWTSA